MKINIKIIKHKDQRDEITGQWWIDEKGVVLEILASIKRAGADFVLTYFARTAAEWLT